MNILKLNDNSPSLGDSWYLPRSARWKLGLLGTKRATDMILGNGSQNYVEIITNPQACYKLRGKNTGSILI